MKRSLLNLFIVVPLVVLLALTYFFAYPLESAIFPKCVFYSLTGLYCPGCGSQRAFSALLHGSIWQAVCYNALFVAILPLLCYSAAITTLNSFRKGQAAQHLFYSTSFVKILLGTLIIFWLIRNLSFYPFNLLAPHVLSR